MNIQSPAQRQNYRLIDRALLREEKKTETTGNRLGSYSRNKLSERKVEKSKDGASQEKPAARRARGRKQAGHSQEQHCQGEAELQAHPAQSEVSNLSQNGSSNNHRNSSSTNASFSPFYSIFRPPHLVAKRNARERRRVQAVNQAFYKLRKCVPIENRNKRVSKVKTLQRAIDYIRKLERILEEDDNEQQQQQVTQLVGGSSNVRSATGGCQPSSLCPASTGDSSQMPTTKRQTTKKSANNNCDQVVISLGVNQQGIKQAAGTTGKQKRGRKAASTSTATNAAQVEAKLPPSSLFTLASNQTMNESCAQAISGLSSAPPSMLTTHANGQLQNSNCHRAHNQGVAYSGQTGELTTSSNLSDPASLLEAHKFAEPYYSINSSCQSQPYQQEVLRESSAYNSNLNYYNQDHHLGQHNLNPSAHLNEHHSQSHYQTHHPAQSYLHSIMQGQAGANNQLLSQVQPQQQPFDTVHYNNSYGTNTFYNSSHNTQSGGYHTNAPTSSGLLSYPAPQRSPQQQQTVLAPLGWQRKSSELATSSVGVTNEQAAVRAGTSSPTSSSLLSLTTNSSRPQLDLSCAQPDSSTSTISSFALVQSPLSSTSSSSTNSSLAVADSSSAPSNNSLGTNSNTSDNSSTVVCRPRSTRQVNNYLAYAVPHSTPSTRMDSRGSHLSFAVTSTSRSSSCSSGQSSCNDNNSNTTTNNNDNNANSYRHQQQQHDETRNSATSSNAKIAARESASNSNSNTSTGNGNGNNAHQVRHLLSGAHLNSTTNTATGLSLANNLHEQQSQYHHHQQQQQQPQQLMGHNQQLQQSFQLNDQHHLNQNHLSSSPLQPTTSNCATNNANTLMHHHSAIQEYASLPL